MQNFDRHQNTDKKNWDILFLIFSSFKKETLTFFSCLTNFSSQFFGVKRLSFLTNIRHNFFGVKHFSFLMLLGIFTVSSISNKVEAQCCTVNGLPSTVNLGFETTFTPNSNFPNATLSPTDNARAFTGNGTTIGTSGWDISSGAGTQLIRDASRASEGADFMYVDFKATDPDNYCIENSTALASSTTCTANRYTVGKRYVIAADYVVFNKNDPNGGTGQAAPIFDYYSGTYISIPAYVNGVLATPEAAVSWANVSTSWKRVYAVRTMTSGTSKIAFSIANSRANPATSGILFDNTSFTQLTVTASGIGAVSCGNNSRKFTLNPESNFGGIPNLKYTVTAPAGYTVSPATGIYGQTTSFTLTKTTGSALGTGPLNITIADEVNTTCTITQAVSDPGIAVAGVDQNLVCSGTILITTATLGATATTGGTWTSAASNPVGVSITTPSSATSSVTGLTPGVFKFVWSNASGCSDTVKISVPSCACIKPNAGTDQPLLCSGNTPITTATLGATAASGGTWSQFSTNPSGAIITNPNSENSGLTGLKPGVYNFIWTTDVLCSDTIKITVPTCPCTKPTAAANQLLCSPTSTTTLTATPTGGFWTALPSNPAVATVNGAGAVSGMTVPGIYNFAYILNGCSDTLKVTITNKPNAGIDQVVCKPLSTTTLTGTASGGTWAVQTGNPATTTVTNLGVVTGMTALGTYKYIYTLNGCKDTVSVTVKNKPTATITQTPATCVGLTPQNNASITINSTGDKYSTDTTTAYASAMAFMGSFTVNNLTPATASTFRIFNSDAGCYIDTVVAIKRIYCSAPVCSNTIGGTVFNDFNNNGVFNTNDSLGFVGVKVYAYNCAGVKIDSAITDYKGRYTFANVTAANDSVRIEFDTKTFPTGIKSTYNGADGKTTVQFVKAPNCNVDLGLSNPIEYCQNNPNFSVICFTRNNDPATEPAIIYMNNNNTRAFTPSLASDATNNWGTPAGAILANYPMPVHTDAATKGQVGTTYGLAYDRYNKKIYSGAYMRAFSPMGTNTSANGFGEGVIYQIPVNGIVADNPSKWLDLETLFGDNIAGTYIADPIYPGTRDFGRTGSNPNKIGYTGLGSIEISGDGKELYVVNLNTQEVFVIPIAADGSAPTSSSAIKRFPIPNSECAGTWADGRPIRTVLGLGVHPKTKKVFVSTTCSGTALTALKGVIYSFDPADNSPAVGDFSKEIEIPMNIKIPTSNPTDAYWYPEINHSWVSVTANSVFYGNDLNATSQHTQPWLAEIAFDIQKDGSYGMVVGTRNRYHDLINS